MLLGCKAGLDGTFYDIFFWRLSLKPSIRTLTPWQEPSSGAFDCNPLLIGTFICAIWNLAEALEAFYYWNLNPKWPHAFSWQSQGSTTLNIQNFELESLPWKLQVYLFRNLWNLIKFVTSYNCFAGTPSTNLFSDSFSRRNLQVNLNTLTWNLVGIFCWNLDLKCLAGAFTSNFLLFTGTLPLEIVWNFLLECSNLLLTSLNLLLQSVLEQPSSGTLRFHLKTTLYLCRNASSGTFNLCWNLHLKPSGTLPPCILLEAGSPIPAQTFKNL